MGSSLRSRTKREDSTNLRLADQTHGVPCYPRTGDRCVPAAVSQGRRHDRGFRLGLTILILRPAWLTDHDEIDYEKDEPFKGTEVSRKSVADLIVKIIESPRLHSKGNIGVDKPNTEGDKPAFY